jgi:hypothetical protein
MATHNTDMPKDVIRGTKFNREFMYYACLFGGGAVIFLALIILGIVYKNTGLIIYNSILTLLFTLATLTAARLTLISKDEVYVANGELTVKKFFKTERIAVLDISRVAAITDEKKNVTVINVTHGKTISKYKFKGFTKEDIAHLRRATSKH